MCTRGSTARHLPSSSPSTDSELCVFGHGSLAEACLSGGGGGDSHFLAVFLPVDLVCFLPIALVRFVVFRMRCRGEHFWSFCSACIYTRGVTWLIGASGDRYSKLSGNRPLPPASEALFFVPSKNKNKSGVSRNYNTIYTCVN